MPIIVPKKIVEVSPTSDAPLIFLVGPIRGGADWQATMAHILLQKKPEAIIACPCRWSRDDDIMQGFLGENLIQAYETGPDCPRQRRWEEHYIQMAALDHEKPGCVLAYLPLEHPFRGRDDAEGHHYATDTRREMGKFAGWLMYRRFTRLVVGGNPAFYGLSTLLDDLSMSRGYPLPEGDPFNFHEDMFELADAALTSASK